MEYNSIPFLAFFAVFLPAFLLSPRAWLKRGVILAGNLVFCYAAGGAALVGVLTGTSLWVYLVSLRLDRIYRNGDGQAEKLTGRERERLLARYKRRAGLWLTAGIAVLVGALVYVKTGRALDWRQTSDLLQFRLLRTVFVPLGISYYTLSAVGYLLDIFWRKVRCERRYLRLLICMSYFPHLVQGPVARYGALTRQLDELPSFSWDRVCSGLQRMLWGYVKKVVIADRLALYTSAVFGEPEMYIGVEILAAVLICGVELYADFSGCMDIVIGASETMGITLDENFRQPFFAESAAEFWRRWHITMGAWFRDYVFLPLALNRRFLRFTLKIRKTRGARAGRAASQLVPLMVTWALTGLWHGTGTDYLVWGLYWGLLIAGGTAFAPELGAMRKRLWGGKESFGLRLFQRVKVYCLFCLGRMLTVTGSLSGFAVLTERLFLRGKCWALWDGSLCINGLDGGDFAVALGGILLLWAADMLQRRTQLRLAIAAQPRAFRWLLYYGAVVLVIVFGVYGSGYDPAAFVYAAF